MQDNHESDVANDENEDEREAVLDDEFLLLRCGFANAGIRSKFALASMFTAKHCPNLHP